MWHGSVGAGDRHADHEPAGTSLAHVFVVLARRPAGSGWNGSPLFGEELFGEFVEADQRAGFVRFAAIGLQHVLHDRYEGGVVPGRDAPAILPPWLEAAFFNTVPTDWWEMLSMTPISTRR